MDWFEDWFDSPLYEKLYANRDVEEATQLVELLEDTLSLQKNTKILDLGCGRGRHAITLNQEGYCVTGIDLSKQAIKTARQKAKDMGLSDIQFEVRDMRDPLPQTFEAIFSLFTTFGYFETDAENAGVFDSVQQMLDTGGYYVLDYMNASRVRRSVDPEDEGTFQGIDYHIHRYIENDTVHKDITFSGESIEGTREYGERVKLYELPWFREQMSCRGLVIDHVFGDYEGSAFDPESSDRLLIMCHKRE